MGATEWTLRPPTHVHPHLQTPLPLVDYCCFFVHVVSGQSSVSTRLRAEFARPPYRLTGAEVMFRLFFEATYAMTRGSGSDTLRIGNALLVAAW